MWTYHQKTGELFDPDGKLLATGYSGNGEWLNNPSAEGDIGHGPLPRGLYHIGPPHNPIDHLGRYAMPLEPTNHMYGRSGFFMHGDNEMMNHTASDGCIIMPLDVRVKIAISADKILQVVES